MKSKLIISLFIFLGVVYITHAQNGKNSVQVIIKGTVTDEFTGKPMSVTMEFRGNDGKKFKIVSNSIDGSYQQVLNAGDNIDIVFTNFDIIRKTEKLTIKSTDKFEEIRQDFHVKRLAPGTVLYQVNPFEAGQSTVSESLRQTLADLDEVMKFNRAVKFELVVSAHDSYARTTTKVVVKPASKKGKKVIPEQASMKVSEPDAAAVRQLVDKRVEALSSFVKTSFAYKDRIRVRADYTVTDSDGGASITSRPSVMFTVYELKNMLE